MGKDSHIELQGTITNCGAGGIFRVQTEHGREIIAHLSGKMRQNKIRVVLGDSVIVAVSPYDPTRGFITFRDR